MIKAEGIFKKFGEKEILKEINLHLKAGEFVTVLGPNGAGKTTLLKILAMLTKPTKGKLVVGGAPVTDNMPDMRRQIGVISHNTFLYGNLTAYENLRFYGEMYQVKNLGERINNVIGEVGLQYCLSDPVRTFSRGMQQRLSIARAILHDPKVLFLDEPYTGLDQHAIDILNKVLFQLNKDGRTIFMITHHYEQGLELSDKILIISRGRIVYDQGAKSLGPKEFKQLYLEKVGGKP